MAQGLNNIATKDNLAKLEAELINLTTKKHRSQRLLQTQITTAAREEITQLKAVQTFKDDMILKDEKNKYQAIEKQKADRLIELEELLVSETEKQQLKLDIEQNFKDQKKIIDDEAKVLEDEEKAALLEKLNEDEILKFEKQKEKDLLELQRLKGTKEQEAEIIKFYDDKITKSKKKKLEDDKKIKEVEKILLIDQVNQLGSAMGTIGSLLGKGTAAGKAAALSDIIIKTGTGFVQGMDIAQKSAAGTGPAAAFAYPVFFAMQIASVLGAVNQAKNVLAQVKGGGGGGAVATPPPTPVTPSLPPAFNTVGTSGTNQLADAIGGQEPARAYVVSGDITTAQGLERNTIEGATI